MSPDLVGTRGSRVRLLLQDEVSNFAAFRNWQNCGLTEHAESTTVSSCCVMPKTNFRSPAQRQVHRRVPNGRFLAVPGGRFFVSCWQRLACYLHSKSWPIRAVGPSPNSRMRMRSIRPSITPGRSSGRCKTAPALFPACAGNCRLPACRRTLRTAARWFTRIHLADRGWIWSAPRAAV